MRWITPKHFPKGMVENKPEELGKISICLLLVLPRSDERSSIKIKSMEKKLRFLLKIYNSDGGLWRSLSLDEIERAMATNLSTKRGTTLRGWTLLNKLWWRGGRQGYQSLSGRPSRLLSLPKQIWISAFLQHNWRFRRLNEWGMNKSYLDFAPRPSKPNDGQLSF